jgi:hypothetical protein
MPSTRWISDRLLGASLNLFNKQTRQHIALVAFLAWVGLGADGVSSSCYGPEEAFLALGEHTHLALYMAAATAITVFVIAVASNRRSTASLLSAFSIPTATSCDVYDALVRRG